MSESATSTAFAKHKTGLMAELSANRTSREPITVGSALHAVGGILIGIAIVVIAFDLFVDDSGANVTGGFIFNLLAILALWFVARSSRTLIVWTTAALQVLVPFTCLWLRFDDFWEFKFGFSLILTAVAMAVLWALPGFRARPSVLAAAVFWAVFGIVLLIVQSDVQELINGMGFGAVGEIASDAGLLTMLLGIGLLVVGWNFDRKSWPNLATPFVGIGVYTLIFGTFGYLSREDLGDFWSSLLVLVLSLAVVALGAVSNRRGTTWIATFFLGIGFFTLISTTLPDDAGLKTIAFSFAIVALILAFFGKKLGQAVAASIRSNSSSTN